MGVLGGLRAAWRWATGAGRVQESLPLGLIGGIDVEGPHRDSLYRQLRGGRLVWRDILPTELERIQNIAYALFLTNPLARRGLEITRDFVLGQGLRFDVPNPDVAALIEAHWDDHINAWEERLERRVFELAMWGEVLQVAFVNDLNGAVRWAYVDPMNIEEVVPNPANPETASYIVLREAIKSTQVGSPLSRPVDARGDWLPERRRLRVIHKEEHGPNAGRMVGDCTWVAINRASSAMRGNSDVMAAIDWLEKNEGFLNAVQEAARVKIAHVWDITVDGGSPKDIADMRKEFGTQPLAGQVRVHNEKVKVNAVAPQLGTGDLKQHSDMLRQHIAAGLGVPVGWLSAGTEKSEPDEPTVKRLMARQRTVQNMVKRHLEFVIDARMAVGQLPTDVDTSFSITSPPVWPIDMQRLSAALLTTTQACQAAIEIGAMTADQARVIIQQAVSQLGVDAEVLDRTTESPSEVDALDDGSNPRELAAPSNGTQPDQLTQRMLADDSVPALGGADMATLGGMPS